MPHLEPWQWLLGIFSAFMIGVAKTGAPGVGTMIAPLMVLTVGDARLAAAWTLPILSVADVFAVVYWRRHTEARQLLSLIPWVLVGIAGGAVALSLNEQIIRRQSWFHAFSDARGCLHSAALLRWENRAHQRMGEER